MLTLSSGIVARYLAKRCHGTTCNQNASQVSLCRYLSSRPAGNYFSNHQQSAPSAQSRRLALIIPNSWCLLALDTVVPDHARVLSDVLALNLETRLGLLGLQEEVVVAMRAVLIALVELFHVFAKDFSALFACEDHLGGAFELVVLLLSVAFCAVEPLATAWRADGDLGVEDVFAGDGVSQALEVGVESWKLPHDVERLECMLCQLGSRSYVSWL
jgi:hypothetical protein